MTHPIDPSIGTRSTLRSDTPMAGRLGIGSLNLLASIQFVWFYVNRVPSCIKLLPYEQGYERTPFQYRLLMMFPLRWAHQSPLVIKLAAQLTAATGWFPHGVRPEGIVEAAIDLACVCVAGLVARRLYQASSRTGLLTPYVYPLTLVMATGTYSVLTMHQLRFVYDLPSLAFFSVGLYLIYFRRNRLLFAALFLIATVNRETTLLLLLFFAIAQCMHGPRFHWRRLYAAGTLAVVLPLAACWVGWHLWVVRHFAANPTESQPRFWLNISLLLWPLAWPQMVGVFCYLGPVIFIYRKLIPDPLLRAWLWVIPAWIGFMLYFGVFIEIRIFGELIPYVAVLAMLLCEEKILLTVSYPPPVAMAVMKRAA